MKTPETPIVRAIRHGAVAGGCEAHARQDPRAASGLRRAAQFHRALARAFLADALHEAGR